MSQYEKLLIGQSIPLMEVDDEESDLNDDLINNAKSSADFYALTKEFGTENFKPLYLNLKNEIMNTEIERKRELCEKLLQEISKIYEFEFIPLITFDNDSDIDEFFDFIEFLEYDYVNFLATIIYGLDLNLLKKDIDKFLIMNWNTIFSKLNNYSDSKNELIIKFIRTNNKDEIYEFVKSRLERDKMIIILATIEREF